MIRGNSYRWFQSGDINAFFGLMLDNVGGMILMAGLLVGVFGFPAEFVLTYMIPGTALGVLVGDLLYTVMAFQLARRTGRQDITAMPLGLDTPSTFGMVFLVMGPAFQHARTSMAQGGLGLGITDAAQHAWFIGLAMTLACGIFKLICSLGSGWIRRVFPRAGLLGSLAAIALVLISFLPLQDIAREPVAGMVALVVILATLTARYRLPWGMPGAVGALCAGAVALLLMNIAHAALNQWAGLKLPIVWSEGSRPDAIFSFSFPFPMPGWWSWIGLHLREAAGYLPVAIPLALATVVGGIDCAESASAAGDDYPTGPIIAVEGFATVVAGLCGGVIQSTPYIGHPAYKAMGARAGYTLATALFVGAAGIFGYFSWIFFLVPKALVFPILVFVGLEITAQSFHATPKRHYPAVAFACLPALAYLTFLSVDRLSGNLAQLGVPFERLTQDNQHWIQTLTVISSGFIVTSLLWATLLARIIDGRFRLAAGVSMIAAVFSLIGIIHSPLKSTPILWPWSALAQLQNEGKLEATGSMTPYHWGAAYLAVALTLIMLHHTARPGESPLDAAGDEPRAH
jgi:AGZA family xanthine/uracil permease-like MFS transporter